MYKQAKRTAERKFKAVQSKLIVFKISINGEVLQQQIDKIKQAAQKVIEALRAQMAAVIKESKRALAEAQALTLVSVSNQTTKDVTKADASDVVGSEPNSTSRA